MKGSFHIIKTAWAESQHLKVCLAITLVLEVLAIVCLYGLNSTYGTLYQAIQDYNKDVIYLSIGKFALIAGVLTIINGYVGFYINRTAFSLRTAITMGFDLINKTNDTIPYYTQRVQEDVKKFSELFIDFCTTVFKAALKLLVFVSVIVTLTKWWVGLTIVGLIVFGTYLTKVVGKRLPEIQSSQETAEAGFRQSLSLENYAKVGLAFMDYNKYFKRLSFTQSGLGQAFVLMPFIVLMPLYISKAIPMGQFFQSVNALGKIIDSLMVLIDNRQLIVSLETSLLRLSFLKETK